MPDRTKCPQHGSRFRLPEKNSPGSARRIGGPRRHRSAFVETFRARRDAHRGREAPRAVPPPPTMDFLRRLPILPTLARLEAGSGRACHRWAGELYERARDELEEGQEEAGAAWRLVARACDVLLAPGAARGPFLPCLVTDAGRSPLPRDFAAEELDSLAETTSAEGPPTWVARVHDLRWCALRDARSAEQAAQAYLHAALDAFRPDREDVPAIGDFLLRAAQLARDAGPRGKVAETIEACLPSLLEPARTAASPLLLHRLLQASALVGGRDGELFAEAAIQRAEREVAANRYAWGALLYRHAEELLRPGRPEQARTLVIVGASLLAEEARTRRAAGDPPFLTASFFRAAIESLRASEGTREIVAGLESELGKEQRRFAADEQAFGASSPALARMLGRAMIALESVPDDSRLAWFGLLPLEAGLSAQGAPAGADAALEQLEAAFEGDGLGLTSTWRAGAPGAARSDAELAAWRAVARALSSSLLEAVRGQLAADTASRRAELDALSSRNRLVGSDRALLYGRGVMAGIYGDPVLSLSLLVPQLRRSLRAVLDAAEEAPSDAAGGELGEDLRLAARALLAGDQRLAERVGEGRLALEEFSQTTSNLVLWLALRLLVLRAEPPAPLEERLRSPSTVSAGRAAGGAGA